MERNTRHWPVHIRAAPVAAGILMVSCAASIQQPSAPTVETAPKTVVAVQNNNWLDVVVYLSRGTTRTRLGAVRSLGTGDFRIPDAYVIGTSDVTLLVRPIGGNEMYTSPDILVFRGAHLALTVAGQIRLSNYAVHDFR